MTTAILQDRRTAKAAGIVGRQEVIPVEDLAGWFQVRNTVTGSGAWHLATSDRCDCRDALRGTCKHQLAVRAAELDLAQYCAAWDARSEQARAAAGPSCPTCGARLETRSYYVGGRGMMAFLVCVDDVTHAAHAQPEPFRPSRPRPAASGHTNGAGDGRRHIHQETTIS